MPKQEKTSWEQANERRALLLIKQQTQKLSVKEEIELRRLQARADREVRKLDDQLDKRIKSHLKVIRKSSHQLSRLKKLAEKVK